MLAAGGKLTLNVTVDGNAPMAYQWFKDSRRLLGATNSILTVTDAGLSNSGTYYLVATNMGGMVISLPALVAVGRPSLLAWGCNRLGQLGNGTIINALGPIKVAWNIVAGAAGADDSLMLVADGTLWGMGVDYRGELGGAPRREDNATLVCVASNVVAVAAGARHSLFVKTDGTLLAAGDNGFGQLGYRLQGLIHRPVWVANNVVALAAGADYSLFVKTDGTLWAMGGNNCGQLGNGTVISTNRPNNVPQISVANIFPATLAYHSLVLGSSSLRPR